MRVADLILDVLAAHGVRDVFGVPGDAINDITDAIRRRAGQCDLPLRYGHEYGVDAYRRMWERSQLRPFGIPLFTDVVEPLR